MNEIWTYEWTNVTWISHLLINMCFKHGFNARYYCVKCTNYEWTNFAWLPILIHEMLNLWWKLHFNICWIFCNIGSYHTIYPINVYSPIIFGLNIGKPLHITNFIISQKMKSSKDCSFIICAFHTLYQCIGNTFDTNL
jgi:hypothetical protein